MRDVPPPPEDDDRPPDPAGHVSTTGAGSLVAFGLVGLVLGWAIRPVSLRLEREVPVVGWLPPLALLFVAVIIGAVAWVTYRALHTRGERMEPHRAVNRLVLAKACALVGALVAGGYFGFALSWLGLTGSDLVQRRVLQSLVAGAGGLLIVAGSLLLERACRVRDDDLR